MGKVAIRWVEAKRSHTASIVSARAQPAYNTKSASPRRPRQEDPQQDLLFIFIQNIMNLPSYGRRLRMQAGKTGPAAIFTMPGLSTAEDKTRQGMIGRDKV